MQVILLLDFEDILDCYVMGPVLKISHITQPCLSSVSGFEAFKLQGREQVAVETGFDDCRACCPTTVDNSQVSHPPPDSIVSFRLHTSVPETQLHAPTEHRNTESQGLETLLRPDLPKLVPPIASSPVAPACTSSLDRMEHAAYQDGSPSGFKWWDLCVVHARDQETAQHLHSILERQLCVKETQRKSCICPMLGF
jgi:hypothetical protein